MEPISGLDTIPTPSELLARLITQTALQMIANAASDLITNDKPSGSYTVQLSGDDSTSDRFCLMAMEQLAVCGWDAKLDEETNIITVRFCP